MYSVDTIHSMTSTAITLIKLYLFQITISTLQNIPDEMVNRFETFSKLFTSLRMTKQVSLRYIIVASVHKQTAMLHVNMFIDDRVIIYFPW